MLSQMVCVYFGSSQTVHPSDLYAIYRTHLDLADHFCCFSSSQMVHLSELYAIYRTHLDLADRLCYFGSSQIVHMDQLYATIRTRNSNLNRIWWIRHRTQFILLVTVLLPYHLRFMHRTQFGRMVSYTCIVLEPSCSSDL
jgi:hypothetical protein